MGFGPYNYEFQDEFVKKHVSFGVAKGRAEGLLTVLEGRGLHISDEVRQQILTCRDLSLLEHWLWRAGTVAAAEELFDERAKV